MSAVLTVLIGWDWWLRLVKSVHADVHKISKKAIGGPELPRRDTDSRHSFTSVFCSDEKEGCREVR